MSVALVTAGGAMRDCVVAADGRISLDRMGGNAVYSAVGARVWREPIGILANIPSDYPAEWLADLEAHSITCDGVRQQAECVEELEWFLYASDGSRLDQLHAPPSAFFAAGFAGPRLTLKEIQRWKRILADRDPRGLTFADFRRRYPVLAHQVPDPWFGVAGLHLAPEHFEAQLALASRFRGATISLDPGAGAHRRPLRDWLPLLDLVDAFLPSEKELAALVPGRPAAEALEVLARTVACNVAVKLGGRGALVWDRRKDRVIAIPALSIAAVDPTGAGDAFCGGFLAGLVATSDPIIAACHGTVSASFAIETFGATEALPPDGDEARRRLARLLASLRETVP